MKRRRANTSHTNVAIFKDISRAARIYEQSITWGVINSQSEDANSFNLSTILVYCTINYLFSKGISIVNIEEYVREPYIPNLPGLQPHRRFFFIWVWMWVLVADFFFL